MSGFGGTGNVLFLGLVLATQMCLCCENSLIGALVIYVGFFWCVYVVCQQKSFKKVMTAMNTI